MKGYYQSEQNFHNGRSWTGGLKGFSGKFLMLKVEGFCV